MHTSRGRRRQWLDVTARKLVVRQLVDLSELRAAVQKMRSSASYLAPTVVAVAAVVVFAATTASAATSSVSTILVKCKNESTCYVVQVPVVQQDNSYIAEAVFLALIFLAAFVLNVVLLVAVATSMDLKRHHHNRILMHMTVPNLVECVCNISLAVGYVASEPWAMGRIVCDVNAFFMYLVAVVQSAFVLWLACDRYLALKTFLWYKRVMTLARVNIICLIIWLISVGSVVVLAPGVVSSAPFPPRYSCSPFDAEHKMGFEIFMFVLVVLICNLGAVLLFAGLACLIRNELADDSRPWVQQSRRRGNSNPSASTRGLFRTPKLSREADATKVSIAVAVTFLLLWIPYIINLRAEQIFTTFHANYTDSRQASPGTVSLVTSSPAAAAAAAAAGDGTSSSNSSASNPNVLPEVLNGTTLSTVLTWFRFIFAVVYPLLVLTFNPQIKLKFESIICCWRSTSIYGESRIMSALPLKQKMSFRNPQSAGNGQQTLDTSGTNAKANAKRAKDAVSFKTPILFATVDGLHLRTLDAASLQKIPKQKSSWLDMNLSAGSRAVWGQTDPQFIAEMCDQYIIDDTLPPAPTDDRGVNANVNIGVVGPGPAVSDDRQRHLDDHELDAMSLFTVDSDDAARRPSSLAPTGPATVNVAVPVDLFPPRKGLASPTDSNADAATDVTAVGGSDGEDDRDGENLSVPSTATSSASSGYASTPLLGPPPGDNVGGKPSPAANGVAKQKKTVRFSDVVIEIPSSAFDFSGSYYEEGNGDDDDEYPPTTADHVPLTPMGPAPKPIIKKSAPPTAVKISNPGRKLAAKIPGFSRGTRESIEKGSRKVPEEMSLGAARRNAPKISPKVDSRPRKIPVKPKN